MLVSTSVIFFSFFFHLLYFISFHVHTVHTHFSDDTEISCFPISWRYTRTRTSIHKFMYTCCLLVTHYFICGSVLACIDAYNSLFFHFNSSGCHLLLLLWVYMVTWSFPKTEISLLLFVSFSHYFFRACQFVSL